MTNIKIAGIGGMGVLRASGILSDCLFDLGYDIKKAEVHGMSQRGGSICSDVRFGAHVASPMIPDGECDFLLVFAEDQLPVYKDQLKKDGILITPEQIDIAALQNKKSLNVALLGVLNKYLKINETVWIRHIKSSFPEKLHDVNMHAFKLGMNS